MKLDLETQYLLGGVLSVLVVASIVGFILHLKVKSAKAIETVKNLNDRIKAWWIMCAIFAVAQLTGGLASIVLFTFSSALAFREFSKLVDVSSEDKKILIFVGALFIPIQYYLIYIKWYGLYSILIPVYAFILIPTLLAIRGNTEEFFNRASRIQWALMLCVYCMSHAPALLILEIPNYTNNAKLLLYLVLVTQLSDILQYVFGKIFGKTPIAPTVSPNKTWEGFIGGVGSATLIGAALWWATPFNVWQAGLISLVMTLAGFAGGLTMSGVKRSMGIKDYGSLIKGHGGVMDRLDSVAFAAPLLFHITRYYFTP